MVQRGGVGCAGPQTRELGGTWGAIGATMGCAGPQASELGGIQVPGAQRWRG